MTVIKHGNDRREMEEEVIRRELRTFYEDREELIDIHVRLTRKRLRHHSIPEIEEEVIEMARETYRRKTREAAESLARLMGG